MAMVKTCKKRASVGASGLIKRSAMDQGMRSFITRSQNRPNVPGPLSFLARNPMFYGDE